MPSTSSPDLSNRVFKPSYSSDEPSIRLSEAAVSLLRDFVSNFTVSSVFEKSAFPNISFTARVNVAESSKSLTSALISTKSGISNLSLLIPMLSIMPGNANPAAIIRSPLLIILPFEISTSVNLSLSRIIPVIIRKGTYIFSSFPLIFIFSYCLFS